MTTCRHCSEEAQDVMGDVICPGCGRTFDCPHGEDIICDGPDAEELGCLGCYFDKAGLDGARVMSS